VRALALVLVLMGALGAWMAGSAAAVFPGANGRLMVNSRLYNPPDPTPVVSFSMHHVRFSPHARQVTGVVGIGSSASVWVADANGSNACQLTTPAPAPAPNGDVGFGPTRIPTSSR
jgi:hypothetical protein